MSKLNSSLCFNASLFSTAPKGNKVSGLKPCFNRQVIFELSFLLSWFHCMTFRVLWKPAFFKNVFLLTNLAPFCLVAQDKRIKTSDFEPKDIDLGG